jgi:phosphoesterase, MJ0936 family
MRILVVSDSHGDVHMLRRVIAHQRKAEVVIHLGDGEDDLFQIKPQFPEKMFLQVRGNCDWGSELPSAEEFMVNGVRIFYTHGHVYNAKMTDYDMIYAANLRKANILLYGHTHWAREYYTDGLYVLNPGSVKGYGGSFGTIEITDKGILTNIISTDCV